MDSKQALRNAIMSTINSRLRDYQDCDIAEQRDRLIALWRAAHPDAATEPASTRVAPLLQTAEGKLDDTDCPEQWINDVYSVTVRRWSKDRVFGSNGGMIQIGISSHDGTARHDFRHMQAIKNEIAGDECEAFELYPAESRLLDPSNYYTLWCFPGVKRLKIGIEERRVWNADEALAPQRGF